MSKASVTRVENAESKFRRIMFPHGEEESIERESQFTLAELEAGREMLARELFSLSEALANEVSVIDEEDLFDEEALVEEIKSGESKAPFDPWMSCGDFGSAANDFPIVLAQWTIAVNAVLRRKAQMSGNNAPEAEGRQDAPALTVIK